MRLSALPRLFPSLPRHRPHCPHMGLSLHALLSHHLFRGLHASLLVPHGCLSHNLRRTQGQARLVHRIRPRHRHRCERRQRRLGEALGRGEHRELLQHRTHHHSLHSHRDTSDARRAAGQQGGGHSRDRCGEGGSVGPRRVQLGVCVGIPDRGAEMEHTGGVALTRPGSRRRLQQRCHHCRPREFHWRSSRVLPLIFLPATLHTPGGLSHEPHHRGGVRGRGVGGGGASRQHDSTPLLLSDTARAPAALHRPLPHEGRRHERALVRGTTCTVVRRQSGRRSLGASGGGRGAGGGEPSVLEAPRTHSRVRAGGEEGHGVVRGT